MWMNFGSWERKRMLQVRDSNTLDYGCDANPPFISILKIEVKDQKCGSKIEHTPCLCMMPWVSPLDLKGLEEELSELKMLFACRGLGLIPVIIYDSVNTVSPTLETSWE